MIRLLPLVLVAHACIQGVDPVAFEVALAESTGCDGIASLDIPLEQVWLQRPSGVARKAPSPSLVATAWAHPGHDPSGDVAGEAHGPWMLQPCSGSTPLGSGTGYEQALATAQLTLVGEARLEANVAGQDIDVAFALDHPVPGIPLAGTLRDGSHVALAFDPWLTLSVLPLDDTDGDGVITEADVGVAPSVEYGLTNPNSWTVTLETP